MDPIRVRTFFNPDLTAQENALISKFRRDHPKHWPEYSGIYPELDTPQAAEWLTRAVLRDVVIGETVLDITDGMPMRRERAENEGGTVWCSYLDDNNAIYRDYFEDTYQVYRIQQATIPAVDNPLDIIHDALDSDADDISLLLSQVEALQTQVKVQNERITELESSNCGICASGELDQRNIQALNEVVNQFKERLDVLEEFNTQAAKDILIHHERIEVLEEHRVAVFPALIAEAEGARSIEIQALYNRVMALEQPATTGAYTQVTSKHYAEIVAERDTAIRERDQARHTADKQYELIVKMQQGLNARVLLANLVSVLETDDNNITPPVIEALVQSSRYLANTQPDEGNGEAL